MSQENVELAQRIMQVMGRRDADELVTLADSAVEWHSFFALTAGGYRGHAGTRQFMGDRGDAFDFGVAEVDDGLASAMSSSWSAARAFAARGAAWRAQHQWAGS